MQALLFSLLTTGLVASDGQPTFDTARVSEWQGLDQEIARLTESVDHGGVDVSGFGQFSYWSSNDPPFTMSGMDVSGFRVDFARVEFKGLVGETSYEVSFDGAADGDTELVDAFATFPIAGSVRGTLGLFRPPFLHSALKYKPETLLPDRSLLGDTFAARDQGAMIHGKSGPLAWYLAVQNGTDGVVDELLLTGRLAYDFLGDGFAVDRPLTGYGDKPQFSVAIAAQRDDGILNGDAAAADAVFAQGPLLVTAELVKYDELYAGTIVDPVTGSPVADSSPFTATGAWQFGDTAWQLVARVEEIDDPMNTGRISVGVNHMVDEEGAIRWQAVLTDQESDLNTLEGKILGLSLTVVF